MVLAENQSAVVGQPPRRIRPPRVSGQQRPISGSGPADDVVEGIDHWIKQWAGPTPLKDLGRCTFVHEPTPPRPVKPPKRSSGVGPRQPRVPYWNRRESRGRLLPDVEKEWAGRVRTAYHEAGHAVISHVLGHPVTSLTIRPSGISRTLGSVGCRVPDGGEAAIAAVREGLAAPENGRHHLKDYLQFLLAGSVAESVKFYRDIPALGSDLFWSIRALEALYPEIKENRSDPSGLRAGTDGPSWQLRRRLWRARRKCRRILTRPEVWKWVEAVAEAALTYQSLNGDQIDALNPSRGDRRATGHEATPSEHPKTRNPAGADLSGADLVSADLAGLDLTGANLTGANLTGANLHNTNLMGAYLFGADLTGADLVGARLVGANLEWSTLRGASLSQADLRRADLTRANLTEAGLHKANLSAANLCLANFTGADLEGAALSFAVADRYTAWPDDFDSSKAGVWVMGGWARPVGSEQGDGFRPPAGPEAT